MKFTKSTELVNASGVPFRMDIERTISLLDAATVGGLLGMELPAGLKIVAYETDNRITNRGENRLDEATGLPSIWLLGMFTPTPTTTVFIPYNEDAAGPVVNDTYFGKVPADRLVAGDGMAALQDRRKIPGEDRDSGSARQGHLRQLRHGETGAHAADVLPARRSRRLCERTVGRAAGRLQRRCDQCLQRRSGRGRVDHGTLLRDRNLVSGGGPRPGRIAFAPARPVLHIQGDEAALAKIMERLFDYDLSEIIATFR